MTSADASPRRLAFERRHGGRTDEAIVSRIKQMADELSGPSWRGPEIRVGVLASERSNAFVLPSGHVYVTEGMLQMICSEDELAAVVAHELSHLDDMAAFDSLGLEMEAKLEVEAAADARAVSLLLEAQYDPAALMWMIAKLSDEQPADWARRRCSRLAHQLGEGADIEVGDGLE